MLAVACSGGSSGADPAQASCPNAGDPPCPSPPPSYKADIQPIIEKHCYGCHGPGGVEVSSINLTTYAEVARRKSDINVQVTMCRMPQPDAGQLTLEEMTTFTEWLGPCSAPDN
jgi:uncharacterized membrane protein